MAVSAVPMQSVRVEESDTSGRSLVATSKFAPGKCIIEELPYAYTLCDNKRGLYCEFCLKESSTLTKCSHCEYVSYCNESCEKEDWARCHKQDCKTLKRIQGHMEPDHHRAQLLSQIIRKQRKSVLCTQDDENGFPTALNQLESHQEKLIEELTEMGELESTLSMFQEWIVFSEDERSSLFKMLGAFLCNGLTILDNALVDIADGIYLRASMVNHSCDPNCEVVFDGRKLKLRTIKDVKEGEEFTICYVGVMNPAKERRDELKEKYHFTCECVKCIEEINALGPDHGSGEELRVLEESWEQIQNVEELEDWGHLATVLNLCGHYLKPMNPSSRIPVNHHLLVKVRNAALNAYVNLKEWDNAAEIGKLITEHHKYHNGPYSAIVGVHLLGMGKILLDLERDEEASEILTEARRVLMVTHGPQHSLMMTPLVQELLCRFR